MDYVIAIPSFKREHALKTHTLRALRDIPIERIFIFVANDDEYTKYKTVLPDYTIIVGVEGLRDQRNFISQYFPLNQKIVSVDDDIRDFVLLKDNVLQSIVDMDIHFQEGFKKCQEENAHLFGFYPVLNKLFMKETITNHFRFIIGSCFGYINRKIPYSVLQKEDYEFSVLNYIHDKKVIRFNYISMKTKYYKMSGGSQSFSNRLEEQNASVKYLLDTYSDYFVRKKSFKSGFPELRLKKV
jgi:hypothetical protein